jgi:hypothetical protein
MIKTMLIVISSLLAASLIVGAMGLEPTDATERQLQKQEPMVGPTRTLHCEQRAAPTASASRRRETGFGRIRAPGTCSRMRSNVALSV